MGESQWHRLALERGPDVDRNRARRHANAAQGEGDQMTRRPANRLPREVLDFFQPDDGRGTWTIREHSQLKRQWRAVRRMPVIVQIIIGLFALTWFVLVFCVTLLVVGGLTMARP
jgi:hypothetical protein